MVFDEKCRALKETAISRGWKGTFYDETEEELFDRGYPSLVEKIIQQETFAAFIFGKNWPAELFMMRSLRTLEEKVDFMYRNRNL